MKQMYSSLNANQNNFYIYCQSSCELAIIVNMWKLDYLICCMLTLYIQLRDLLYVEVIYIQKFLVLLVFLPMIQFCPHAPRNNIISIMFYHNCNCNQCNSITCGNDLQHTGELLTLDTSPNVAIDQDIACAPCHITDILAMKLHRNPLICFGLQLCLIMTQIKRIWDTYLQRLMTDAKIKQENSKKWGLLHSLWTSPIFTIVPSVSSSFIW